MEHPEQPTTPGLPRRAFLAALPFAPFALLVASRQAAEEARRKRFNDYIRYGYEHAATFVRIPAP